jgi:hypothetical protein
MYILCSHTIFRRISYLYLPFMRRAAYILLIIHLGYSVAQSVEALRYNFISLWSHWICHWPSPFGRTMALVLTQPLTEMRNICLGGKGIYHATMLKDIISGTWCMYAIKWQGSSIFQTSCHEIVHKLLKVELLCETAYTRERFHTLLFNMSRLIKWYT